MTAYMVEVTHVINACRDTTGLFYLALIFWEWKHPLYTIVTSAVKMVDIHNLNFSNHQMTLITTMKKSNVKTVIITATNVCNLVNKAVSPASLDTIYKS